MKYPALFAVLSDVWLNSDEFISLSALHEGCADVRRSGEINGEENIFNHGHLQN
jgi:hypothetical protein